MASKAESGIINISNEGQRGQNVEVSLGRQRRVRRANIDTLFSLGGAMFAMASQYVAARSFIWNPNVYANVVQATDDSYAAFQKAGDIKSMRDFLSPTEMCLDVLGGKAQSPRRF